MDFQKPEFEDNSGGWEAAARSSTGRAAFLALRFAEPMSLVITNMVLKTKGFGLSLGPAPY